MERLSHHIYKCMRQCLRRTSTALKAVVRSTSCIFGHLVDMWDCGQAGKLIVKGS